VKGQSAIEYLTTYGWMLLAVSIAGTTFYTTLDTGCSTQLTASSDSELSLKDVGITRQGLAAVFTSPTGDVTIDEVNITNKDINRVKTVPVDAEGTSYVIADANKTEGGSCQKVDLQVSYDTEYLSNLDAEYELELPVGSLENLIKYLRQSGGDIPEIKVQSTVKATNNQICFGRNCPNTESDKNSKVNRSGDTIYGTVQTKEIDFECIGGNCKQETGSLEGYLNRTKNTADGTLKFKEIKPINKNVCIGACQ